MTKAISQRAIFEKIGYEPHLVQRRIHAAARSARFRAVCAGRRTGKSTLGGHELTPKAIAAYYRKDLDPYNRRSEHWIVGPEYSDAEKEFRVLWGDLQRLGVPLDKPGSYYNAEGGNMHLKLWGGKFQVHAKSAKYPDSLVGEGLESVILAEAAKLKPIIWSKYLRPTLADYRGDALMTSTPEGKNWFYDMWQLGQKREAGFWSIRMPSWSNPVVFPEGRYDPEILSMAAGISEEKFNQEIGAEFTEFVGRVFKDFDEESHVGHFPYNPRWPLYIATDYGFTNPNVALFIQVDNQDNVRVIAEYYERNRRDEEFAQDILDDPKLGPLARAAVRIYPDPEDPGATKTLSVKWKVRSAGGTGGLLTERLDLIRRWMSMGPAYLDESHPDFEPKLKFDYSCKNAIREFQDYRYPELKRTDSQDPKEAPLKKDDHTPEALGRFFRGHFGHTLHKNTAHVSTAKVRSVASR